MTVTITTADLAAKLDTTPRTLRKFLRNADASGIGGIGQGKRYALPSTKKDITAFTKKFATWSASQDEARKVREAVTEVEAVEDDNEVESDMEVIDDNLLEDDELDELTDEVDAE